MKAQKVEVYDFCMGFCVLCIFGVIMFNLYHCKLSNHLCLYSRTLPEYPIFSPRYNWETCKNVSVTFVNPL